MKTEAIRNLVFEGGGVKGIAYGGALAKIEELGILGRVKRVGGTSAGAITAAILALGCDAAETTAIINSIDYASFQDGRGCVLAKLLRFVRTFGLYKGDAFLGWMEHLVEEKTGKKKTTFAELRAMSPQGRPSRGLYVVVSNLTTNKPEIFSAETTPEVPVALAVRMSMSIPFFFKCVKGAKGAVMVDGGVIYNYPIDLFDATGYLDNPANGLPKPGAHARGPGDPCVNRETLGLRLGEATDAREDEKEEASPQKIDNLFNYSLALVSYMRKNAQKLHLEPADWSRTVYIDSSPAKVTEFNLPPEKVQKLLANGEKGAEAYFAWALGPDGPALPE
jgi:NTE family protein